MEMTGQEARYAEKFLDEKTRNIETRIEVRLVSIEKDIKSFDKEMKSLEREMKSLERNMEKGFSSLEKKLVVLGSTFVSWRYLALLLVGGGAVLLGSPELVEFLRGMFK